MFLRRRKTSAIGRKQTVSSFIFCPVEWPLLMKADAQKVDLKNRPLSGWYAPESSRWSDRLPRGCL